MFAKEVDRRLREKREADRAESGLDELAMAVMATDVEIEALRVKLDRYDTITVEALMENERLIEQARATIDNMLGDAYVLPDGRRAFKTKDGRVFDEYQVQLSADEIDPDMIEDWRPGYENYVLAIEEKQYLYQERQELLTFQQRIDEAREKIEADDLTKQDIDAIEEDLKSAMPQIVASATIDAPAPNIAAIRSDFAAAAPANRIVVPDLARDLQHLVP